MSSVVRPGAVFHPTSKPNEGSGLMYCAFTNTDGSTAFVVLNEQYAPQTLSVLTRKGKYANITVPARAVCSARWR